MKVSDIEKSAILTVKIDSYEVRYVEHEGRKWFSRADYLALCGFGRTPNHRRSVYIAESETVNVRMSAHMPPAAFVTFDWMREYAAGAKGVRKARLAEGTKKLIAAFSGGESPIQETLFREPPNSQTEETAALAADIIWARLEKYLDVYFK